MTDKLRCARRGFLLMSLFFITMTAPPDGYLTRTLYGADLMLQESPADILRRSGAKQLDSGGTEFELDDGVIASLTYSGSSLAVVQVSLSSAYKDERAKEPSVRDEEREQRYCCMYETAYARFLGIVTRLKPLGEFVRRDPVGVIPTAGWIRRTDEYGRASIVRLERNCSSPEPLLGCGVARFSAFYWLALEGKVKSKRVDKIGLGGTDLIRYSVRIDRVEVAVSQDDYYRLRKGETVRLERMLDNSLARIITVEK